MRQCMDADNLHRRLKKIIGQVQAIDRMVDEDVPCEDVLSQINAAKSALHKVGQVVLEGHIQHCVRDGIEHGDADKTIENFTKAVERFCQHDMTRLHTGCIKTAGAVLCPLSDLEHVPRFFCMPLTKRPIKIVLLLFSFLTPTIRFLCPSGNHLFPQSARTSF